MGQHYVVTSASAMDGTDQHGNVSFWCNVEGSDLGVLIKQKDSSPAPQPGTQIFGRMESAESKAGNDYLRFRREQQENGAAPQSVPGGARGDSSGGSPSPEFWAQKDKRLARAGMTQAVVGATTIQPPLATDAGKLAAYVANVALITDALLASLNERAPSPNETSPPNGAPTGTSTAPTQTGAEGGATPPAPSPPVSEDLKLALAACGHDNADPQATYQCLTDEQQAQVNTILTNLKTKGEATIPDPTTNFVPDDEGVPF